MAEFYLYRHIRLDTNQVFYIGIGKKRGTSFATINKEFQRAFNTWQRTQYWKNVFNKCGKNITIEIIMESDSLAEIKAKEKEFITLYGRANLGLGSLVNLTDGGEGAVGRVFSKETLEKRSKSRMGKCFFKHTPESKAKLSLAHKGRKHTPEAIKAFKKGAQNRKRPVFTEEHRNNLRKANLGQTRSPEHRAKIALSMMGKRNGLKRK